MLTRKDFIVLLSIAIVGAAFAYELPVIIKWINALYIDQLRFSIAAAIAATIITFIALLIIVGLFLVWCCAKYGEHQANKTRKLYKQSIANYDDQDYN